MSLLDTRRTNFALSKLLIWTKYLQCALQKMYEVAYELYDEKEALKDDLAVAEAKQLPTTPSFPKIMRRCLDFDTNNSCYNNK